MAEFINGFTCRLQWQVRKGLDVDLEYRYLMDFQRHLTQASVEKPAVEARNALLSEQLRQFRETSRYRGDEEFQERTGLEAGQECDPTNSH